ncbi:ribosome assembly RNA-binding protein YhbY [Candidatus Epulonipiscium viviparus]|uniref:ribosome assembly RNA-binding protein YhbY n=1 Tax=Candidatus Epulonipiscium viviparus TaxID=420336 RepID=UPI00016BFDC0|nr:ribosome assembly RNA-binding protein YhbY [Candidatus Epulopiscium viviparus]
MTSKQRAHLRSLAQNINSTFQVGKNSVTPELVIGISEALAARELIKITVLNNCDEDITDIAQMLAERSKSQLIQIIGKKIILYKMPKKNPKIILPEN